MAFGLTSGLEPGLVLLNTTSFSGVSSAALPTNTFTSSYTNYKIKVTGLFGSTSNDITLRLRKAGVDNSTASSYVRTGFFASTSTLGNSTGTSSDWYATTLNSSSTVASFLEIDLFLPFVSNTTGFIVQTFRAGGDSTNIGYGRHTVVDSFDSLNMIISTGTFSGTYSVYGFNI